MTERYIQCRFTLAVKPWRDTQGNITGVDAEMWYDGMTMDDGKKAVAFDLEIPESLWDPPVVKGRIKSQIAEMFEEFIEGMELKNAN